MTTQSAAQWSAFVTETVRNQKLWTVHDESGIPCPINSEGKRAMPFWSSQNRIENIIKHVSAYQGFKAKEIDFTDFIDKWLEGLQKDNLLVGVNWTGKSVTGYDLEPNEVKDRLKYEMDKKLK